MSKNRNNLFAMYYSHGNVTGFRSGEISDYDLIANLLLSLI